jgi:membrane associated rhomboid family serine protease
MSSGADLFIVCKNCGSEVSPYITECPYCGHRLRRRAPKLPRPGTGSGEEAAAAKRTRRGMLGRLGSGEESPRAKPAAAPRRLRRRAGSRTPLASAMALRPYATIALVAAGCVMWVLVRADFVSWVRVAVVGPLNGDWWKVFSSQFAYLNGWYAFFTLLTVAIFGWLLERRHGPLIVLALFLLAGVAGSLVALAAYPFAIAFGGNAGALALLAAWAAPDLRDARADRYYDGDLLGAGALAALMLALPFVRTEASWLAGVVGGVLGLLVGLGLPQSDRT